METRTCKTCGLEKSLTIEFFNQDYNKRNGIKIPYWARSCKVCTNKDDLVKTRKYKQKNRKKLSKAQSVYYRKHKVADGIYKRAHYIKNKAKYLLTAKNFTYNKRKTDITFILKEKISRRVWGAITKNNKSIAKYLTYTMQELKQHIEKLFEPWMTWENYGTYRLDIWDDQDASTWTWQIDHIVPHSKFKYNSMEDQAFRDCWALSNLRPYSAKQNLIDGDRK
ncbi:MAG TPA: hypothetical protein VII94_02400 [Candidatus Saccharimonadales bacterium]